MNIDMTCPAGNGITIPLILPLVPIICPHRLRRRASILSRSKCRKYWCDAAAAAGDAASSPFAMPTIPSQTLAYNFPTRTTTTTAAAYSYSASSTENTIRLRALSLYRRLTFMARSAHADAQSTEVCTLLRKNRK